MNKLYNCVVKTYVLELPESIHITLTCQINIYTCPQWILLTASKLKSNQAVGEKEIKDDLYIPSVLLKSMINYTWDFASPIENRCYFLIFSDLRKIWQWQICCTLELILIESELIAKTNYHLNVSHTLRQCSLAGPVYTRLPLECHWLTQCTLGYHWAYQRILAGYTGTPLEKTAPHWDATGETQPNPPPPHPTHLPPPPTRHSPPPPHPSHQTFVVVFLY